MDLVQEAARAIGREWSGSLCTPRFGSILLLGLEVTRP